MKRDCLRCRRRLTPNDLDLDQTRNMEADRRASGLDGVRFLYCHCPGCGADEVFVDILPLAGESDADFEARRDEMEAVVRRHRGGPVEAAVVPILPHAASWAAAGMP